jgi:hypothetical protein
MAIVITFSPITAEMARSKYCKKAHVKSVTKAFEHSCGIKKEFPLMGKSTPYLVTAILWFRETVQHILAIVVKGMEWNEVSVVTILWLLGF